MALVSYSSSSDGSDVEPPEPKISKTDFAKTTVNEEHKVSSQRKKLPLPSAISCINKVIHTIPVDDPAKHDGRIRSFEHERGNWATLVYIPVDFSMLDDVISMVQSTFEHIADLKVSDNIHISLTKTVILRHHWIKIFLKSIQETLIDAENFLLDFQSFNVYVNEERTRTFIGLVAGNIYFEKLHKLMFKMDNVMTEFRLDTFYEDPSFHASILWCVGDCENLFKGMLSPLNTKLSELRKMYPDDFRIRVDQIHCKSGNKCYDFNLK